eukprot:jgi/Ulvmu1/10692/UM067_0018.1
MPRGGCVTLDADDGGCVESEGLAEDLSPDGTSLGSSQSPTLPSPASQSQTAGTPEHTHNHCAPANQTAVPILVGAPNPTVRTSSCTDNHGHPDFGKRTGASAGSESQGTQRGQIILVATGACMLLVSGALLIVLCVLCVKRYRRRSAVQRSSPPSEAINGMQPPLWDPYPRGGVRSSLASASSGLSPKGSSHHHLYVELPDSTLALAVKDPPSASSGRVAPQQPFSGGGPPPFLMDVNPIDAPAGSSGPSFPHTIHFTSYMPILLHPALTGVQVPGAINASLQPISPLYAAPAGLPLADIGQMRQPGSAATYPSASSVASSRPLSEGAQERPIDPDLLRRRQPQRGQPYQEMLYSCNSDSTADTVYLRLHPQSAAAAAESQVMAIGLPSSEGMLGPHQRGARAAIGLPSIAPPVDAAAGGALVAALSQRDANAPALGLPVSELRTCHSAPQSARTASPRAHAQHAQTGGKAAEEVLREACAAGGGVECTVAASAPIVPAEPAQHDEACASPSSVGAVAAAVDAEDIAEVASVRQADDSET